MQSFRVLDRRARLGAALVAIASLIWPHASLGQAITSDGTLGTAVSNTGDAYTIDGGRRAGTNLFHSFSQFSVPNGGSAIFNRPDSTNISNVLSRVTGGQASTIDGLISTRAGSLPMPNANFFLINPAGVMFGPGASIDVGGTFHASSSERILFEGGGEFSTTTAPNDVLLLSAPPQAFGFLGSASPIATDGTMGTVVVDSGGDFTISGGTYKEANLFHSFLTFSLPGGNAFFEGLPATQNVISRVTGGSPSDIDGFISTRLSMSPMLIANFFLINPAGVVFGPGAVLDVGGSIHISTADQLIFPDRVFSAAPQSNELNLLSSSLPQAFGFLSDNPLGIDVNGAVLFVDPHDGLAGRTLSLVGGDITVRDVALLLAPGGVVQLVSVDSPGRVNLASPDLGVSSFSRLGLVKIEGDSTVMASGSGFEGPGSGGSVVIRSGQLMVESGGWVLADTIDAGAPQVGVDIQAKDSVAVSGGGLIWTSSSGSDTAGGVSIATDNLTISGGGAIQSRADNTGGSGGIEIQVGNAAITGGAIQTFSEVGSAGNIVVAATGTVTLSGPASEISSATVDALGNNAAGNISVTAADIALSDRALIRSGRADQQAGKVNVSATNTLSISSLAGILSRTFSVVAGPVEVAARQLVIDRGFITTSTFGARDAGPVIVNADTVSLVNGAQIASSSQAATPGAAGVVTINAPVSLTISGVAPDLGVSNITFSGTSSSGVFSTAQGSGDAGQISLVTPQLTLSDRARVTVATTSTGDAGGILANVGTFSITGGARADSSTTNAGVGGSITINGDLSISGAGSGLFSTTSTGTGNAGAITIAGSALTLADGGKIAVTTSGSGNAGTILADVASVSITSGGQVDSSTSAGGAGGAITVNGTLAISGTGSGLFSTASGARSAGAINATGQNLTVTGGGTIDSSTTGAGAGGAINVSAGNQVEISSGGSIRADSLGSGPTGNITISAGDQIVMNDGSISTNAETSDGGNITLRAPNLIRLGDSRITTSVKSGTGRGGNIFIDPKLVLLQGSTILADAFGGPGGSITIVADNFVTDAASLVQASSALSTPGTVRIQSPENNLKEAIAQLPGELVDASRLMRAGCAARHTGAPSSFAVAGRGGVPADADGYLPSFSTTGAPLARAARQEERAQGFVLAMASWDCMR